MTKKLAKHERTFCAKGKKITLQMLAVGGFLAGTAMMQSCDKDILTGQPEWLGNSIYERLQEGITTNDGQLRTFKYTIQLIQDLDKETAGKEGAYDYVNTLSKTGSRTLFATPDDVFEKWLQGNNDFGVHSYDELTLEMKKQLINGSMIKNAYLLNLLSNAPATGSNDPELGESMRRETAVSIFDNVPIYKKENFPHNSILEQQHIEDPSIDDDPVNLAWARVRQNDKDICILKDQTTPPMIHFLPDFMKKNNIKDEDLQVISNNTDGSVSINDSYINGKRVISSEQTCKNGYIYVIDGVMDSNKNMAEIIRSDSRTQIMSRLLDRFSVPVPLPSYYQTSFWRLYPEHKSDSLYALQFLNEGSRELKSIPNNSTYTPTAYLPFDPGWNQFVADGNSKLRSDFAVMIAPTDEALTDWFENGSGKQFFQEYKSWDGLSSATVAEILANHMKESFISAVPSKFEFVLDKQQRPLGIKKEDIVHTYMGCNGVVYVTNKVFEPSSFSSVLNPLIRKNATTFSTMYRAINGKSFETQQAWLDFSPYLGALDSRFSLVIPCNAKKAINPNITSPVFRYLDPCSYGLETQYVIEFYTNGSVISAQAYPCTVNADGTVNILDETGIALPQHKSASATEEPKTNPNYSISSRLYDIINNNLIVEDIVADKKFYLTKGGSVVAARKQGDNTYFQGGYQLETGEECMVNKEYTYNMGENGNGTTYGVSYDPNTPVNKIDIPMTASKSVYQLLKEEADKGGDHLFFDLLFDNLSSLKKKDDGSESEQKAYKCANYESNTNISLFDNYNYTVYVPSDAAIKDMIDKGYLPTWDDYNEALGSSDTETAASLKIRNRIENFLRYHIQDNSIYVGGEKVTNTRYESSMLNPTTKRFYSISVTQDGENLTVEDMVGNKHSINKAFYNKPCREYWIEAIKWVSGKYTCSAEKMKTEPYHCSINSSSNAVVHKIDGVMLYDSKQLTEWKYASSAKKSSRR